MVPVGNKAKRPSSVNHTTETIHHHHHHHHHQQTLTCSKSTIETLEEDVKFVQS